MSGLHLRNGWIGLSDGDTRFRLEIDRLEISPGDVVALTGASGSGKTLALELLGLLRAPGSGTGYSHDDTDLAALWAGGARGSALARTRGQLFGFVPQTGGLVPFLTVMENIRLPQRLTHRPDDAWITHLTERLGLTGLGAVSPANLSIGQRQRVAIARALAHRPPFVIADEPTAALDPENAETVLTLFLDMARERETGVIVASHDLDRIARHGIRHLPLTVRAGDPVISRLEGGL